MIDNCFNITDEVFRNLQSLTWLSCYNLDKIVELRAHGANALTNLTQLYCQSCQNITSSAIKNLISLKYLNIDIIIDDALIGLNSLETMHLQNCNNINGMALHQFPKLKRFSAHDPSLPRRKSDNTNSFEKIVEAAQKRIDRHNAKHKAIDQDFL